MPMRTNRPLKRLRIQLFGSQFTESSSASTRVARRVTLVLVALWRKLPYLGSSGLDALVVSTGGAGTTALLEHLSLFLRVNDPYDRDSLKHRRFGGLRTHGTPVLILTRRAEDVVASLERRRILDINAAKLGLLQPLLHRSSRTEQQFNEASLSQISSWSVRSRTLVLQYEELANSVNDIARFLEIPSDQLEENYPFLEGRGSS